jgi:Holliday junction resolvase RusA-like endonuclease
MMASKTLSQWRNATPEVRARVMGDLFASEPEPEPIRVTLPIPPTANFYWRVVNGHAVTSQAAREYKALVGRMMAGTRPLEGPVRVTMTVYRPRRAGDLDNYSKVLFDALQGFAYRKDSQVVESHHYRDDDKDNPRVEVTVEPA